MRQTLIHLAAAATLCLPALVHAHPATSTTAAVLAQAQHGPGVPDFGRGGGRPGMGFAPGRNLQRRHRALLMQQRWAQLGLSDSQRERLRELRDTHERQAIERRAQLQLARLDLRRLMRADHPDPEAVNAQIDRLARLRAEQMKSAYDLRLRAQSVLTDEQLQKLRSRAPGAAPRGEM
jgi:Spy/CpxP family protein refolding chaperone